MAIYIDACAMVIFAALIVDLDIPFTEACLEEQYIGCYEDTSTVSSRSNWMNGFTDSNIMSIELCIETCEQHGKTYAILQNGRSCQCGDVLNFNLSDASCDKRCSGNDRQVCGGSSGSPSPYVIYSVCPIGYYGVACNEICHCKEKIPCNLISGICETGCEDSWTLSNCSKATDQYLADKSIGCYLDKVNRAMEYEFGYLWYIPNAIEKCSSICASKNYPYTGLEVGIECFCGGSYTQYGSLNDSRCDFICYGEIDQHCGGNWALNVYFACPNGYFGLGCMSQCNYAVKRRCVCDNSICSSECKSGWMGRWCDIRNCSDNNGDCAVNETCVKVDLVHSIITRCNCKAGYQRNQLWDSCTDIDECYLGVHRCDKSTTSCINTLGGYQCECLPGYNHTDATLCGGYGGNSGFPTNPTTEPQENLTPNGEQVYSLGAVVGAAIGSAIGSAIIFASILIVVLLCRRMKQDKISGVVNGVKQKDNTDATYESPIPPLHYDTLQSNELAYTELDHSEGQLKLRK